MRYTIIVLDQWLRNGSTLFEGDKDEVVAWLMNQSDVKNYAILPKGSIIHLTPSEFLFNIVNVVVKHYRMDPETEDLLPDGNHLADGMKVLVGDSRRRSRPEEMDQDWQRERIMIDNRWCTVSNVKIVGDLLSFVGIYDDGVKIKRTVLSSHPWLVKIDSIPDPVLAEEKEAERYNKVYVLVREAVRDAIVLRETDGGTFEVERIVEETTKTILGLF